MFYEDLKTITDGKLLNDIKRKGIKNDLKSNSFYGMIEKHYKDLVQDDKEFFKKEYQSLEINVQSFKKPLPVRTRSLIKLANKSYESFEIGKSIK